MKKSKSTKSLDKSIKDSLHSAIEVVWEEVLEELERDMSIQLGGYDKCFIWVQNGHTDRDWWESKLSDMVTEYLKYRNGSCGLEESEWCDAIAADMEKQAKRLRKHAEKLRSSPPKSD